MGIRPARCYKWDSPAYTRKANNPGDSFITGVPGSSLRFFNMGSKSGDYDVEASIISDGRIQIRHNALEAARVATNKVLEEDVGMNNYYFVVRVFPHHVMRENVMATGAGADRVQSGMRRSFGKPIGYAARVKKGQAVFTIYINKTETRMKSVKSALKVGMSKLPGDLRIVVKNFAKQNSG